MHSANAGLHAALADADTVAGAAAVVCDHLVDAGMPMPSIYVEIGGRLRCLAQRGYWQVHDGVPPEVGLLGATFRSGTPSIIADVTDSPDFIAAGEGVVGEITFPFSHHGTVVGCVNVESRRPLTDADVTTVRQATVALSDRVGQLGGVPAETIWQRLSREAARLAQAHDHRAIAALVVESAPPLIHMDSAILVTLDRGGRNSKVAASHGPLGAVLESLDPATIDAIAGWTGGGASVYTFGQFPGSGFSGSGQVWDVGVQALVTVPVAGVARNRGFLLVAAGRPHQPSTDDVMVLELYAAHVGSTLHAADAVAELRRQATRDTLTGLGHSGAFHADLHRLMRGGDAFAVLLIDLDKFKQVNDTGGHLAGDRVLVEVAQALARTLRGGDRVYRIGGDEFAALVGASDEDQAVGIAERLRQDVRALGTMTVSVGVRQCGGNHDGMPEALLADADLALYEAKARGRDRIEVFRPHLRHVVLERAQLAAELDVAIDRNQLRLDYQSIVDLDDGSVLGAEALVRWDHPTRGVVPPDEFIDIAEEDGQIWKLGVWVLGEAVRQLAEWRHVGGLPLFVTVNVSGSQLQPALIEVVRAVLADHDVPPSTLMLEITESAMVEDDDRISVLAALRDLGVRVAVDDFGTGYSSLSYLRRLPIDVVKIDRSFVAELHDERNTAVARTVLELTRTLELGCIAEGVETAAQLDQLRALGWRQAQGYWWCRPGRPEAVVAMALARAC